MVQKLTKKQYLELINTEHYNTGMSFGFMDFDEITEELSKVTEETIIEKGEKFIGCMEFDKENFIHIISNTEWKEERHKKVKFYVDEINDITFVYHKSCGIVRVYAIL